MILNLISFETTITCIYFGCCIRHALISIKRQLNRHRVKTEGLDNHWLIANTVTVFRRRTGRSMWTSESGHRSRAHAHTHKHTRFMKGSEGKWSDTERKLVWDEGRGEEREREKMDSWWSEERRRRVRWRLAHSEFHDAKLLFTLFFWITETRNKAIQGTEATTQQQQTVRTIIPISEERDCLML